ncbi:unnamed protein product [Mytilus coruscus]|uniref:Mutator-like transposase domain-containing protein n=1 Tax=Mytilus coruscus TaxID=42192 RepID=A0A6J8EVA9_MYTCO|nr:unnamed protein product [Mytilus coruscus]
MLCPKLNCNHNNDECKQNYSTDESMASTEGKFVQQHLNEINSKKILKVRSVTSDASAQISKSVNDYSKVSEDSEENIIVTLKKLTNLIIGFIPHNCSLANPDVVMSKRLGTFYVSVKVVCTNCGFSSEPVKLYSTMKSPRGPDSGVLNNALLIPVIKSKVGISDIITIMSCLNIQCLSRTVMQRKVNKISDLMVDINKKTMIVNQEYVKKVLELAGQDNSFDAKVDSSFKNRPKAGFEAASQTFCRFI